MKRFWPRILSAFSTLAVGLVAASLARLLPATSYEGYTRLYDYYPLFTTERTATLIKGPGMREFILDPFHSQIPQAELEPSLDGEHATGEEFLRYNYRELTRLAARGNAKQREWLRNYLQTCDESALKQSLLTALGGEQP